MSISSMLFTPDVILVILVVFFLVLYIFRTKDNPNLPPGPPGLPVLGNLWSLSKAKKIGLHLRDLAKTYGPVFSLKLGPRPAVVLNGYDAIKEALVDKADIFSTRPYLPTMVESNRHEGILFSSDWKERRRLALTSMRDFGLGKKSLDERIKEEAVMLIERLKESDVPNLHSLFPVVTNNIICAIIRNERFDYDSETMQQIIDCFQEFVDIQFFEDFDDYLTWFKYVPSMKNLKKKPMALFKTVTKLIMSWINEHKETFDEENIRDLIDLFIAESRKPGGIIKDQCILQMVSDLFAAGTETTSTTLLWCVAYLIVHKDVQDKCRKEVFEVVGKDRMPEYDDSKNLIYLNAFLKEVQRIANILPHSFLHNTSETTTVQGHTIPKDTIVMVNLESALKDEKYFPDPFTFRPERWIDQEGRPIKMPAHIPFSAGKRVCLGEQLAKKEMFIFLTTLIQNFEFTMVDAKNPPDLNKTYGRIRAAPKYNVKIIKL